MSGRDNTLLAIASRIVNRFRPLLRRVPGARIAYATLAPTGRRDARDARALRRLLHNNLRPDSSCVDIGAHTGEVAAQLFEAAPKGRHLLFEPLPELAEELRRRFAGADVIEAAVSDVAGQASFVHYRDRPAWSGFVTRPDDVNSRAEEIVVDVVRLDDALPGDFRPALIKIDVEGAELLVLRGGIETLRRHRPIVVFEHARSGAAYYEGGPGAVHGLLTDLGFRIFDLSGKGPFDRAQFRELFESGTGTNFAAMP